MSLCILVTNDDGISAPGLAVAEEIATQLAGRDGQVTTIAPAIDQSGVGHSVSYLRPSLITEHEKGRYSVEGSPADCVLAGVYYVMKDYKPDIIISGVNKGHNISEDILYSGTVGAAMEGSLQGVKSISLSQCYSAQSIALPDTFDASRKLGYKICDTLIKSASWNNTHYNTFYNVNFPAIKAEDVKGITETYQGQRRKGSFAMEGQKSPNGRTFLWINHKPKNRSTNALKGFNSDMDEINKNKITVTPLKADLTEYQELEHLQKLFSYER